jgi:lipoate-protein ligase A
VPTLWVLEHTRPAVVLGSTQPWEVVDHVRAAAAGVDVVRRRSGGGAVLLVPGDVVWVDVILPSAHPRWLDDVGRAAHWVGAAWVEALGALGVTGSAHRGPMVRTPWSDLVCFAGVGPGEVVGDRGKLVGISQRRTRHHARFQCAALLRWDPAALVDLLAGPYPGPATDLDRVAAGTGLEAGVLADAFVEAVTR